MGRRGMQCEERKIIMKRAAIIISPNWRDYAQKYLADCLDSIKQNESGVECQIFLVDNETSIESFAFMQSVAPDAEIFRNTGNDGFAKGCNDPMRSAIKQEFDYIVLLNIDTEIGPNAISEMIKVADSDEKIGAVQARIMLHPEADKVNSLGNSTHFLGFGFAAGYRQQAESYKLKVKSDIFYPSGAAVLFKREALEKVGLFDEEFWMYNEDQELGWRFWLAGYKNVLAPDAVVYHKYEFSRSVKKYFWMDRNRILSILKCYHWGTLLLILPAFLAYELGLILFAIKGGWIRQKMQVYKYFLKPGSWQKIVSSRALVQKTRIVKDRDMKKMIVGEIAFQEFGGFAMKLANAIFGLYWKVVKIFIIW